MLDEEGTNAALSDKKKRLWVHSFKNTDIWVANRE
jgi:hypothetical protein